MLENNKWYGSKRGSVFFKTGRSHGFGLSGYHNEWDTDMDNLNFNYQKLWTEITSPKEVLEAINKGMKSIGYHNKVKLVPFFHIHKMIGSIITFVKLRDFHFDFNNEKSVDLLMNKGELWLTDNKADICILKNGRLV